MWNKNNFVSDHLCYSSALRFTTIGHGRSEKMAKKVDALPPKFLCYEESGCLAHNILKTQYLHTKKRANLNNKN